MLAAFMEDRNIRWGELVGGMLIVFCSTALVVSLWAQIAAIPILKFFIFTAVTASFFGAGLYMEHRWKLPTTSRGVLIIASLLVPLNFLAIAAFSESATAGAVESVLGGIVALLIFTALSFLAGRVLTPEWPALAAAAVVVPSAAQLLIRWLAGTDTPALGLVLLAALPLAGYAGTVGWMVRRAAGWELFDRDRANRLFIVLGVASFAALLAMALLIFKTGRPREALQDLAALVSLMGAPAMACGLLLWKRLAQQEVNSANAPDSAVVAGPSIAGDTEGNAGVRTAGTAVGLAGAAVMLAGLGLAWPEPGNLLLVALLNALVFAGAGLIIAEPAGHVMAGACVTLAYLLGYHLLAGHVTLEGATGHELTRTLLGNTSGPALVGLVGLAAAGAIVLHRLHRFSESLAWVQVAGGVLVLSVVLTSLHGLGRSEDHGATWVFGIYCVTALAGGFVRRWSGALWAGSGLLLVTLIQGLAFRYAEARGWSEPSSAWFAAMLMHATVIGAAAVFVASAWGKRVYSGGQRVLEPLRVSAFAVCGLALLPFVACLSIETTNLQAWRAVWWAVVGVGLAYAFDRPALLTAAQAALTVGVGLWAVAIVSDRPWFTRDLHALSHPGTVQAVGIALNLLGLAWLVARLGVRAARGRLQRLGSVDAESSSSDSNGLSTFTARRMLVWNWLDRMLRPAWPTVDQVMALVVLVALVILAITGIRPGLIIEFAATPEASEAGGSWNWGRAMHALGSGSWWLWATLLVLFIAGLWERFEIAFVLGIVVALWAGCLLLAGHWTGLGASASVLRWLLGGYWLAASAILWVRVPLTPLVNWLRWPEMHERVGRLPSYARRLLMALTVAPVLIITLYRVLREVGGFGVIGPDVHSLFGRMGEIVGYGVPLILVSAGLIGHGVRERSPRYLFCGGLVLNLTVTLAWMISVLRSGREVAGAELTHLIQLNVVTTGGYGVAWLAARAWRRRREQGRASPPGLLHVQTAIALIGLIMFIAPAAGWLVLRPDAPGTSVTAAGSLWGWLAWALSLGAAGWLAWEQGARFRISVVCLAGLISTALVSFSVARVDAGNWAAYHTLLVGTVVLTTLVLLRFMFVGRIEPVGSSSPLKLPGTVAGSCEVADEAWLWLHRFGGLALLLALRGTTADPGRPWWTAGAIVALSVLAGVVARVRLSEVHVSVSGVLFSLAANIWWLTEGWRGSGERWLTAVVELIGVNVITLTVPSLASLWMTLSAGLGAGKSRLRFHEAGAVLATLGVMCITAIGLGADAMVRPFGPSAVIDWLALAAAVVISAGCLWDRGGQSAWPLLCLLGLASIGLALGEFDLPLHWLAWYGAVLIAAYSLVVNAIARFALGPAIAQSASPDVQVLARLAAERAWLVAYNVMWAAGLIALASWVVFALDADMLGRGPGMAMLLRTAMGLAVVGQSLALGLLAAPASWGELRDAALYLSAGALVLAGWAIAEPGGPSDNLLNRMAVLMSATAVTAGGYGLVLGKLLDRETSWTQAAGRTMPVLGGLAAMTLVAILSCEAAFVARGEAVEMHPTAIGVVIVVLLAAAGVLVAFATRRGRDPLGLSESGRMGYVYAAEVVLALLVAHVRLTMPWLFRGFFEQFWPAIVMAISFVGVGLGEVFRRQGRRVLAEPLERSGIVLPLLPVLGFWVGDFDSRVDYSVQLIIVGVLYAMVAVLRKSFVFALLAALAGNGALWYLWHRAEGLEFVQHPQLWLIPAALSLLVAAYLNRRQLTEQQMTTIRYISITTIYVSSTADIFLNGVREAPWLPLVLAGLSVAGVLAGIVLRIRSFLFLGSAFLVLALVTMIWHAAADFGWTWLWYLAGIALGAMILAVFALFEKKREAMLEIIENMKGWQA
ncbi:MAG: hypothetical protein AMXMBFR13_03560 [Phycisphaerae bacterium]